MDAYTLKSEIYRGHTLKIIQDDYPESPREWDNFGTMVYWGQNMK